MTHPAKPDRPGTPATSDTVRDMVKALEALIEHADDMEAQHEDYHGLAEGGMPCRSAPLNDAITALAAHKEAGEVWRPIAEAPKDGTEIWAYTTEGKQRVVWWEEAHPSAPDDPGHDAGWLSVCGETHPACFYHEQQPASDPPTHFMPLPSPPAGEKK